MERYFHASVGADSYVENYMQSYAFEVDRLMKRVGKPVDRSEWLMPPQMVNAYYNQLINEIAFPAAILQPPFFDPVRMMRSISAASGPSSGMN